MNDSALAAGGSQPADVRMAIEGWRKPDPAAVGALGVLAGSGRSAGLGLSSARALARIHTLECVPHLALMLDSAQPEARQLAVEGLSLFLNKVPVLDAEATVRMAYLSTPAESQRSPFWDLGVAPYLSPLPVPAGRLDEHVVAWKL